MKGFVPTEIEEQGLVAAVPAHRPREGLPAPGRAARNTHPESRGSRRRDTTHDSTKEGPMAPAAIETGVIRTAEEEICSGALQAAGCIYCSGPETD